MPRIAKKSGAYHHGDLRRVLLETAVKVIDSEGVSALSLQALARRAGVSSGAPYHHFESREQLLAAIASQGFELLSAAMRGATAEADDDAAAQLCALGRGYIRFALAHPGHFRVMFRAELQAQRAPEPAGEDGFEMLRLAVVRCQDDGLAAPGDPMPLILAAWTCVHGAAALWIDGSLRNQTIAADPEAFATLISGTITRLIAAQAPNASGPPDASRKR
jgi:AcrR family transcriptional regulator